MQDIDFDKKVKEMMESHHEAPPFGSWEKISSALDRKRARVIYFRRGLYAVSAVAASLLLLLFIGRDLPEQMDNAVRTPVLSENNQDRVEKLDKKEETKPGEAVAEKIRTIRHENKKVAEAVIKTEQPEQEANPHITDDRPVNKPVQAKKKPADNRQYDNYYIEQEQEKKSFRDWLGERKYKYALSTNLSSSLYKKSINLVSVSLGYQNDFIPSSLKESVQSQYVSDRRYAMPVSFGVQFQTDIDKKFSVGTGLIYTLLASNYQEISQSYSRDINQALHYVGIPLNAYYNLFENNSVKIYITAGTMLEKGVVASYRENTDGVKKYYSESIPGVQLSAGGGLGLEWKLNKDFGIYLDPSMTYYFKGKQPSSIRTAQPLQYRFEMGMRFEI
ncbi:MAG: PorT family protein [Bacteroidales bacterium]|nr:PorT family protein [Bacteroidales bacterium]